MEGTKTFIITKKLEGCLDILLAPSYFKIKIKNDNTTTSVVENNAKI